ncbi:NAD(P)H-dependent oxidoreductase [Shouchella patagoniensis]|uniref:NAD(P)H-dependent oxidoreductase n=1 Tax=Shouchella patagoniensis TaxID=228576 RepID=UPI00099535AB|nr:NAD(P)H-dependent oxidoreductase [Shouchella patagoniensis]
MNLLILYIHPNHTSLTDAFLQSVLKGSKENSNIKNIQVLDLYEENFNPVLLFNKDKRRRDMYRDPELEIYRDQITWADKLVFVYPIWWGRPPAILMGYVDRVFAANFAYKDKKGFQTEGLLQGKSVVCISTMKGPTHYPLFLLNNAHKALMKKAVFQFVGMKKVTFFEFGYMESRKGKQAKKLAKIQRYFQKIAS